MVAIARPFAKRVACDRVCRRDRGMDRARRDDVGRVEQLGCFKELSRVDETLALADTAREVTEEAWAPVAEQANPFEPRFRAFIASES